MSLLITNIIRKAEKFFAELSFNRYAGGLSFIIILAAVIRASTLGLAYDEAYTYVRYADPINFFEGRGRLNNHLLNTVLIYILHLLAGVRYNDFLVRLPNLIFYTFYCYTAYLYSSKLKYKYLIFSLFVLNYYLFQYFYNGRGYGIGAACILLSCYFMKLFENTMRKEYFNYFILFSCLAVLAQGLCIYISTALLIVIFVQSSSFFSIKDYIIPISIYSFICLCVGCFIIYVSRSGYPVYAGGYTQFFLGVGDSLLPISGFSMIFGFSVILLFIYSLFVGRNHLFIPACIIYIGFALLAHLLLGRGLPAGRELLPFYPLVICAIAEALQSLSSSSYIYMARSIIILLIIIFSYQAFLRDETSLRSKEFRSDRDKVQSFILQNIQLNNKEIKDYVKGLNHMTAKYYLFKYNYLEKQNNNKGK